MDNADLRFLILTVIAGLIPATVGCAPAAAPEPAAVPTDAPEVQETASKVFKLGIMAPFSGPSARTGEEFKGAAEMAFGKINYQIGDYKFEAALNLHSSVAVSCMDIAAKHKIPHFFPYGATEVVNEKFASDPEKYGISYVEALEDAIARGNLPVEKKTVAKEYLPIEQTATLPSLSENT